MIPSEERLKKTANELSAATGSPCLAVRADVRDPKQVQAAVKQTIERYGRIDFVINGNCPKHTFYLSIPTEDHWLPGAAGNFLAPISGLSENGFRTVIEIDTVSPPFCVLYYLS
jgi:peroxisomal 2,4-dienoyl-CoA reductase